MDGIIGGVIMQHILETERLFLRRLTQNDYNDLAEILQDEMVNFKYKSIVEHYIFKDTDPETTLESQLYYMTKEQFSYKTYQQLKARVKVSILEERKTFFGKSKTGYVTKVMPLAEFVDMNLAQKKAKGVVVQELALSKLGLMSFSI